MAGPTGILLIEDNPDHAALIQRHLRTSEQERIAVVWESSLKGGLSRLDDTGLKVVLLDLFLPDADPLETLRTTLARAGTRPVIVLTSLEDSAFALKALQAGAQDYLSKDRISPETLLRSIRYSLERKTSERLTRESEERFRAVFELAPVGVAIASQDLRFERVNRAFCELTGYSEEELLGSSYLDVTHPDDLGASKRLQEALTRGGSTRTVKLEKRYLRKDGSFFWGQVAITPLMSASGAPFGYLAVVEDITEHNREMEKQRSDATSARRANRAKTDFLAQMSHEIRTPLSSIIGFGEILQADQIAPEERKRYVQSIVKNGRHLLDLINSLLDISKIEAGQLEIERSRFSLRSELDDVILLFADEAREKGISLRLDVSEDLPDSIVGDPTRVRQILVNLVGNAVKFTDEGGVELEARLRAGTGESGERVEILVKDTGIGIRDVDIPKLFQPFGQGESAKKRLGTGLGLFVSRRVAEMLGGDVELVSSAPGRGSVFSLSFTPAERLASGAPAIGRKEAPSAPAPALPGTRILVIEDNSDTQLMLRTVLDRAGAEVKVVGNGEAALELPGIDGYDAMLMDMRLPGIDGVEVTRRLRRAGYPGVIVALTADAIRHQREACLDAGCDAFLAKPSNPLKVIGTLRQLLSEHRF